MGKGLLDRGKLCDRPQTPDLEVGGAPLASLPVPGPECFQAQGLHQPLLVPLGTRLHADSWPLIRLHSRSPCEPSQERSRPRARKSRCY